MIAITTLRCLQNSLLILVFQFPLPTVSLYASLVGRRLIYYLCSKDCWGPHHPLELLEDDGPLSRANMAG
jgi:hypothetical protein